MISSVTAQQWFRVKGTAEIGYYLGVGYYRHPDIGAYHECLECGATHHEHGFLDIPPTGYAICPGDWVVLSNGEPSGVLRQKAFTGL